MVGGRSTRRRTVDAIFYSADPVPAAARGFGAGKKVKGGKRFIVTDTLGLLLAVHVGAASIQDRDGANQPLPWPPWTTPESGRSGPTWASPADWSWTAQILGRALEIVHKDPGQRGFQVQPKRWAVERTFSWLTAHRRLARDYETSPAHSKTLIRWAVIGIMARRLTRGRPATRPGPRSLSPTEACGLNCRAAEGSPLTSRTQSRVGPTPARCSRM
ncbi:transposase [Streptomyces sp. NPDC127106]|uniref:transposase n=1 Tax=Streptomyces sp. NPDC127106 TaxID=3345360 RepID=UPI003635FAE9